MKKLIIKAFKDILNLDVRVINLPEDDIDMAIYVVNNKKMGELSEKELAEFSYDFAITRLSSTSKLWVYMVIEHTDGVVRNGEPESPPDSIERESEQTYLNAEFGLKGLIISIINDRFNDILMCREEMEEL